LFEITQFYTLTHRIFSVIVYEFRVGSLIHNTNSHLNASIISEQIIKTIVQIWREIFWISLLSNDLSLAVIIAHYDSLLSYLTVLGFVVQTLYETFVVFSMVLVEFGSIIEKSILDVHKFYVAILFKLSPHQFTFIIICKVFSFLELFTLILGVLLTFGQSLPIYLLQSLVVTNILCFCLPQQTLD
jgi:hypothetical protein